MVSKEEIEDLVQDVGDIYSTTLTSADAVQQIHEWLRDAWDDGNGTVDEDANPYSP